MKLTNDQENALNEFRRWWHNERKGVFKLFGYAGTGKTSLLTRAADIVDRENAKFVSFTGKAVKVLQSKGCENASTIHSLIYNVEMIADVNDEGDVVERLVFTKKVCSGDEDDKREGPWTYKLIIVDECSMVNTKMAEDLTSYDVPVLAVGDPFQLPPVGDADAPFAAGEPNARLNEVVRVAAGNPIIDLSMAIRNGELLEIGSLGGGAVDVRLHDHSQAFIKEAMEADQIIVKYNDTRNSWNIKIRRALGFHPGAAPQVGEKIVCLKNIENAKNGEMFRVAAETKVFFHDDDTEDGMRLFLREDGVEDAPVKEFVLSQNEFEYLTKKNKSQSSLLFGYGFAMTAHKAQGSQWDNVVVIDERPRHEDKTGVIHRRWLYTAATRAAKRLIIIPNHAMLVRDAA